MRPSVRAEKYIRDASGWRKDVTNGNDNGTDGQTDRQTDRVRRNMRPPPREEGRIIIIEERSVVAEKNAKKSNKAPPNERNWDAQDALPWSFFSFTVGN